MFCYIIPLPELLELLPESLDDESLLLDSLELLLLLELLLALLEPLGSGVFRFQIFFIFSRISPRFTLRWVMLLANLFKICFWWLLNSVTQTLFRRCISRIFLCWTIPRSNSNGMVFISGDCIGVARSILTGGCISGVANGVLTMLQSVCDWTIDGIFIVGGFDVELSSILDTTNSLVLVTVFTVKKKRDFCFKFQLSSQIAKVFYGNLKEPTCLGWFRYILRWPIAWWW